MQTAVCISLQATLSALFLALLYRYAAASHRDAARSDPRSSAYMRRNDSRRALLRLTAIALWLSLASAAALLEDIQNL